MATLVWPTPKSCPGEKGTACAAFLARAATYFASHGIDRIERVMTDKHFSYRHTRGAAEVSVGGPAHIHPPALPLAKRQG